MKICLVGAGGGIGRQLLTTFSTKHAVTPVYRTLPQKFGDSGVAVRFEDEAGLAEAVGQADVVVHAALNTKAKSRDFIAANNRVTERLLDLIGTGNCRLFVYFSSQVVYAALDAREHPIQDEDATLAARPGLDNYTRLKLDEEARVIAACRAKNIAYLIVRPTVVMGPNMQWSSGIVAAMRMAPLGLRKRTINLIHVEDLAQQLLALIERGVVNDVVNLGDLDVSSDDYFRHAAGLAKRPIFFAPDWLAGLAGKAIPSTLWFLSHDVTVASEKVRRLSGVTTGRTLADFFEAPSRTIHAHSLAVIQETVRGSRPYHAIGRGYFLWFNDRLTSDQLVMEHYAGIVSLDGDRLTVRAGTTLRAILAYLGPYGMTLGTLPEFVDISAGACFFAEVHGSSSDFVSVYDLITAIRYVDGDGEEKVATRDDVAWDRMREGNGIVVTEVTFQCCPNYRLANVIEWRPDSELESFVAGGYRVNHSTTVHWFPRSRELMVYNINPAREDQPKDRGPFAPLRGSPAAIQKLLLTLRLRGRLRIVGWSERVLAPWTGMPAKQLVGRVFRNGRRRMRNMEICVPDTCAARFIAGLRQAFPGMRLPPGQGVGVRFTRHPATGRGFVWVEMTSRNAEMMHALVDLARDVCGNAFWLHRGKYVPKGIGVEHLFIPRSV
ncbi:MAG: NAD-dependent epimerase/dehydratase family protein [Devosia sp.]|uniref:NAD-dependent epimerase/dehydratase family protein n=1 Tax=Devosia sp. TaxID=1871048 RepID=UPI0024C8BBEB|nr:NAD-dependent epimerase/dehydratase family protein [Devosia sp.]UYO00003.1 MAG: NAD-dependent epimerase/dehydratase family protein [Devosia sp.]